ncbi:MAG: type II secretion system F family protein [Burkholderiales bacterium]
MPEFDWRAADASGQITQGRQDAATSLLLMKQLRERGLTPLSIDAAGASGAVVAAAPRASKAPRTGKGPVNQADVLAMTSQLAIMVRAGLALDNALRVLIGMNNKPAMAALTQRILDDVKGGAALSKSLAKDRALFGDFYINMIRSGEASGQLSNVLTRLVEHMERLRALRDSVISATIYPAILLGVSVLSLIVMLGFVVPQFQQLFKDMGDALPIPTRIVMQMGEVFTQYGLFMLVGAVLLGALLTRWLKSPAGRTWFQARVLRLPVLGSLMHKYEMTLFARSLGTLLGNGVPLLTALQIATETVGNQSLRLPLQAMSPKVKEGVKVVEAASVTELFEPLAINLIRVGEETGRLGPMMLELANVLNREVETGIKRALTMLEPLLILVLGVMIAAIIVSILLGILSVNDLAA